MLTLTATDLPRAKACNGSIFMDRIPQFDSNDADRDEGNAAHWLIEQVFNKKFGTDELVDRKAFNGFTITGDMVENCTPFLDFIRGRGAVEQDTSYGDGQRYQINGRADWLALDGTYLNIDDFKYGWSLIEPVKNWTLLSHGFGWLFANPALAATVTHVTLRIWQPRPHHPLGKMRSVTYTIAEMWAFWAELEAFLINPDNQLHTGLQCYKCPSMAICPAAHAAAMNAIDVSEMAYVSSMDNGSLAFFIDQSERAIKILEQNKKAASELALHRIKAGQVIPGYSTERELTNRQWKKGISVEMMKLMTGKDLTAKVTMVTPAQAEKLGIPEEQIDALCERNEKGTKLVKRDANTAVKKMFKGIV